MPGRRSGTSCCSSRRSRIVVVFSFGKRAKNGGYAAGFTLDNYAGASSSTPEPFITSLRMAIGGHRPVPARRPAARLLHRDPGRPPQGPAHHPARHPVLDELPHPDLRLADRSSGRRASAGSSATLIGDPSFRILGTPVAVLLGLVYGYLPLMVFPLYVTLERMDRTLVEASKDLGAGRWATFRQITLPIALPGLITGSILVFIPMMGEYVIPQILGYGRTFLDRQRARRRVPPARNWPVGVGQGRAASSSSCWSRSRSTCGS